MEKDPNIEYFVMLILKKIIFGNIEYEYNLKVCLLFFNTVKMVLKEINPANLQIKANQH